MSILISNEQLSFFENHAYERYIDSLVSHYQQKCPDLYSSIDQTGFRQALKSCIGQAEAIGFNQKGCVQLYIDMVITFGIGFTTDPQYPWIALILKEKRHLSQLEQAFILHHQTENYLSKICGAQNQFLLDAAYRLERMSLDTVSIRKEHLLHDILVLLHCIYPQKYAQTEEHNLIALVESGIAKAQNDYQFEAPSSIALIVALMFFWGHRFEQDPFYPWATVENSTEYIDGTLVTVDGNKVARALEKQAKLRLKAFIQKEQNKPFEPDGEDE